MAAVKNNLAIFTVFEIDNKGMADTWDWTINRNNKAKIKKMAMEIMAAKSVEFIWPDDYDVIEGKEEADGKQWYTWGFGILTDNNISMEAAKKFWYEFKAWVIDYENDGYPCGVEWAESEKEIEVCPA